MDAVNPWFSAGSAALLLHADLGNTNNVVTFMRVTRGCRALHVDADPGLEMAGRRIPALDLVLELPTTAREVDVAVIGEPVCRELRVVRDHDPHREVGLATGDMRGIDRDDPLAREANVVGIITIPPSIPT